MNYKVFLSCFFLFLFILTFTSCNENSSEIYFIQNQELFAEYKGKKELDIKYEEWQNVWQNKIDSLEFTINQLKVNKKKEQEFQEKLYEYQLSQNEYQERSQELQSQYFEQVWRQLNSYIEEYGKEKAYKLILGANGNGGIMYAEDKIDITKEVLEYVNSRYEGN